MDGINLDPENLVPAQYAKDPKVCISTYISMSADGSFTFHGSHRDWKTWKNGKAFPSQGILSRLEKSGNFTQSTGTIRKNYYTGKLKKILEKSRKFVSSNSENPANMVSNFK